MTRDDFLALPEDEQMSWLVAQTDEGREVLDICDEMGCTRADLQGFGYTWALGQWRYLSMKDRAAVVAQN